MNPLNKEDDTKNAVHTQINQVTRADTRIQDRDRKEKWKTP